jgi:threonine dehydrogenase-like Zn-dependent dehydrogenase
MTDAKTMSACVLYDARRIEVRHLPRPQPGPRDVLVRVSAVGLCGTDVHIYRGEANYNFDSYGRAVPLFRQPQILGHEITGVVEAVSPEVQGLGEGDRVAIDQGLNCMSRRREPRCEYCLTGDSHQCEFYAEHGITGLQGGLAEYIAVPDVNAVRVDSDLEPAKAALTEPLACVTHALDAVDRATGARYRLGAAEPERRVRSVLILGAGPAGLLFTQYLRKVIHFDGLILVSEPNTLKRQLAAWFGAEVIDPTSDDLAQAVIERTEGGRVELLIEASGAAQAYPAIAATLRKQATLLLYGHGRRGMDLSVMNGIQFKEPVIISPVGGSGGFDPDGRPSVYRRALTLLEHRKVEVAPFISHRYRSLDKVSGALEEDFDKPDYTKGIVELF